MRLRAALLAITLILVVAPGAQAQPAPGPAGRCEVFSDFLSAAAAVYAPVPILEVQVTLQNKSLGPLRVEPAMFKLTSRQTGTVGPLTFEQAREVLQNPAQTFAGLVLFGVVGLLINIESQRRWTTYAEANIFKGGELPPEATVKGSLFFRPNLSMTEFALAVEGLTAEGEGALPPLTMTCPVPTLGGQVAAPPPTNARAYVMTARATSGPLLVRVERAEFTPDATTLTVAAENGGDGEANFFNAIADAVLTDDTGKAYAVRILRSTMVDRVSPRQTGSGRLVFAPLPLPPAIKRATLTLPGIRAGESVVDVKVELRF